METISYEIVCGLCREWCGGSRGGPPEGIDAGVFPILSALE